MAEWTANWIEAYNELKLLSAMPWRAFCPIG
jgi:hypothetical protein